METGILPHGFRFAHRREHLSPPPEDSTCLFDWRFHSAVDQTTDCWCAICFGLPSLPWPFHWRFETLYYMSCKKDRCRRRVLFRSFPCTIPRCTHPNSRHCKIRLNHFYLFVSVLDSCKPCHWWSAKALEASFETSPGRLEQMRQAMMQAAQEAEQERKARCSCSGMKLRKHPELI